MFDAFDGLAKKRLDQHRLGFREPVAIDRAEVANRRTPCRRASFFRLNGCGCARWSRLARGGC